MNSDEPIVDFAGSLEGSQMGDVDHPRVAQAFDFSLSSESVIGPNSMKRFSE